MTAKASINLEHLYEKLQKYDVGSKPLKSVTKERKRAPRRTKGEQRDERIGSAGLIDDSVHMCISYKQTYVYSYMYMYKYTYINSYK